MTDKEQNAQTVKDIKTVYEPYGYTALSNPDLKQIWEEAIKFHKNQQKEKWK